MKKIIPSLDDIHSCLSVVLPDLPNDPKVNLFLIKKIDSLSLIETVVQLENYYSIQFEAGDLNNENLETLERIHATVIRLLARENADEESC